MKNIAFFITELWNYSFIFFHYVFFTQNRLILHLSAKNRHFIVICCLTLFKAYFLSSSCCCCFDFVFCFCFVFVLFLSCLFCFQIWKSDFKSYSCKRLRLNCCHWGVTWTHIHTFDGVKEHPPLCTIVWVPTGVITTWLCFHEQQ